MKKFIILVLVGVLTGTLTLISIIAYSYTQLDVSFSEVSSVNVELEPLSFLSLIKLGLDVLSGSWLEAALDVIAGISMGLVFELTNNGILPVYVPEISYDLFINEVFIGNGITVLDATIYPGEIEEIRVMQNFQKDSFSPAIESILNTQGIIEIKLNGVAYFELLGFSVPVKFESSKQISIVDEIQNQLISQSEN